MKSSMNSSLFKFKSVVIRTELIVRWRIVLPARTKNLLITIQKFSLSEIRELRKAEKLEGEIFFVSSLCMFCILCRICRVYDVASQHKFVQSVDEIRRQINRSFTLISVFRFETQMLTFDQRIVGLDDRCPLSSNTFPSSVDDMLVFIQSAGLEIGNFDSQSYISGDVNSVTSYRLLTKTMQGLFVRVHTRRTQAYVRLV